MKHPIITISFLLSFITVSFSQTSSSNLDKAVARLMKDTQMRHALLGLYVVNENTGKVICNINGDMGMAPASSQKVVTAATAFELLGEDYRYATIIGCDGKIENNTLTGNLYIKGSGDPTLGSDKYAQTKESQILQRIAMVLQQKNIQKITGYIILDGTVFKNQPTPSGWPWGDIGNYYGAGSWGINWRENQFDIILKSGSKINDDVEIIDIKPNIHTPLVSYLKSGAKGSGDNSYIYLPPYGAQGYIEGTIPSGEEKFKISGAVPDPYIILSDAIKELLKQKNIILDNDVVSSETLMNKGIAVPCSSSVLDTLYSPSLDSIIYRFLQKSVNLYGEALAKTLAVHENKEGTTKEGVDIIRKFWNDKGIELNALKMLDGSGLSPENRVTPHSLVNVLMYAKKRQWFSSFYKAIPLYNNMKMKSGTIKNTKAFAGYTKKDGQSYTFSIIINNYDGTHAEIVKKMYDLLNQI